MGAGRTGGVRCRGLRCPARCRCAASRWLRRRAGGAACWSRWPTAASSNPKMALRAPGSERPVSPPESAAAVSSPRLVRDSADIETLPRQVASTWSREKRSWSGSATRRRTRTRSPHWRDGRRPTRSSQLGERLAPLGGSVVELPRPPGWTCRPRCLAAVRRGRCDRWSTRTRTFPYRDVDPVWFATAAYVIMFGMMFGDVGDGLLLVVGAFLLRRSRESALCRRPAGVALGSRAGRDGGRVRLALRGGVRSDRASCRRCGSLPSTSRRSCCWPASASVRSCLRARTASASSIAGARAAPARPCGHPAELPVPRSSSGSRWSSAASCGPHRRSGAAGLVIGPCRSRAGRSRVCGARPAPVVPDSCRQASRRST